MESGDDMRFKDEKTGEIIGVKEFLVERCGRCGRLGYDYSCALHIAIRQTPVGGSCARFFAEHPETAAEILGYKVIKGD